MLVHNENFNLEQITESGQCFRMNKIGERSYSLVAFGRYLELEQRNKDTVWLNCTEEEYTQIWNSYFDLEYEYGKITEGLMGGTDGFLKEAAGFGRGIRILRQEFFEVMISFIISQNKNIPSIKRCIEALCRQYGVRITQGIPRGAELYSFPRPEVLAQVRSEELRKLKVGYRDSYILCAAQAFIQGELDEDYLENCSDEQAMAALMRVHGIGRKVASCICLYGLHRIGMFPVDVWMKRIFREIYHEKFDEKQYKGYMGIVQQYMFYYMRNKQ